MTNEIDYKILPMPNISMPEYMEKVGEHIRNLSLLKEINQLIERKKSNNDLKSLDKRYYEWKETLIKYKIEYENDIFKDDRGRVIDIKNVVCASLNRNGTWALLYKKDLPKIFTKLKSDGRPEKHHKQGKTYDKNNHKIQENKGNILEINHINYELLFYYEPPYEFKQINKSQYICILDIIRFHRVYIQIIGGIT